MDLHLDDLNLKATVRPTADERRVRLTIEYPRTDEYRDRARAALVCMIAPTPKPDVEIVTQETTPNDD